MRLYGGSAEEQKSLWQCCWLRWDVLDGGAVVLVLYSTIVTALPLSHPPNLHTHYIEAKGRESGVQGREGDDGW